jgi:exonuclease VII small subunit
MWSTSIARLLNKYNELSTKYATQLSNLNIALNNYHDVYDQSDIWYEGNETITTLRSNLEEARQVVSDIYQLEIAKDNWLSKLDSAYE